MITVGYGDITPQNSTEIIFTILTMFVTGMTWGFSISKIEKKEKYYKESMNVIHTLMREENIRSDFRDQISNYLKYIYNIYNEQIKQESNEVQKQQEQKVIQKLSNQLRLQLISEIHGQYLENISFIQTMETKSKIIFLMEECLYSPGEIIFKENCIDDCALYYIVKGEVEIVCQSSSRNSIIQILQKSSYFGEISFITGQMRNLTAKATDFCRVYKINREKFLNLIKESERDYEEYVMIRDNIIFKNNYSIINKKCFHCSSEEHFSINCPKTHLVISKKYIANRQSFSVPHLKRQNCERRQQFKWKTWVQQKLVYQAVYQINANEDFFELLNEIEQKARRKTSLIQENEDTLESSESNFEDDNQDNLLQNKQEDQQQNQRRNGIRKIKITQANDTIQQSDISHNTYQDSCSTLNKQISNNHNNNSSQVYEKQMSNSIVFQEQIRTIQREISNIQNILQGEEGSYKNLTSIKESCQYIPSQCKIPDKQHQSNLAQQQNSRKKRKSLTVGLYQMKNINIQSLLQHQQQLPFKQQFPQQQNMQNQQLLSQRQIEINQLQPYQEGLKNSYQQLSQFNQNSMNDFTQNNKHLKPSILKIPTKSISKLDNILEQKESNRQKSFSTSSKKFEIFQQEQNDQAFKIFKKQRSSNVSRINQYARSDQPSSLNKICNTFGQTQQKNNPLQNNEKQPNNENSFYMLQNFEKGQIFKYYYPKQNYTKIIKLLKKMQVPSSIEKNSKNIQNTKLINSKQPEFKSSNFSPFNRLRQQQKNQ